MWDLINQGCRYDVHLRLELLNLYEAVYGLNEPPIFRRRAPADMKVQLTIPSRASPKTPTRSTSRMTPSPIPVLDPVDNDVMDPSSLVLTLPNPEPRPELPDE
eukprot:Ihof_evm1s1229 gene=Ihof_evmTU1s1229